MRKYLPSIVIALFSSLLSVFVYRLVDRPRVSWSNEDGEAKYTSLVDKLLNARSQDKFHSSSPTDFIISAEITTPSVVNIRALQEADGGLWGGGTLTGSSGSGVIISPDGFIVTNNHVVERSTDIKVTMSDKREFKAKVVGSDASTDIAVLKISVEKLPFIVFGNSDSVRVGEWVLAVGNPFNLSSTVTAGIVSAKGRNIDILGGNTSIESFIQTDAAVNPGNSGGALVNSLGELIGINTAIITESGSYEGYSFAVPSNLVQKVVRDLREFGIVQRAFLGVGIQDLDSDLAKEAELPNAEGVYVNRITANGGAQDAGLNVGDIIIGMNNVRIKSTPELQEFVGRLRPGDEISLDYWRNNKKYRSKVVLKDSNNATASAKVRGDELEDTLGIGLRELKKDEKNRLKLNGCVVSSIRKGTVVHDTNMQPGFIITSVNGSRVSNASETIEAITAARSAVSLDGYYEGEPDLYSYRFKK
jgi:serine protease Do